MALKINSVNGSITINPEDGAGDVVVALPRAALATQEYVATQISTLVDSAPGALDTLNELAAALGDDANFATTVTDSLATKAPLSSPTFTGTVTATNVQETVYSLTGTEIDPTNGGIQTKTLSGGTTFTEVLSSGESVVLMIDGGDANAVTWPTITWVTSAGNAAPTLTANDTIVLWKVSTTLYGAYTGSYA
jgi:hypothetical protein